MKILFWSRLPMARDLVIEQLRAEPGIELTVSSTLAGCIASLTDVDGLILYNSEPNDARALMEAVLVKAPKLRWMHFLSAGKEGFAAAPMPAGVSVTQTPGASAPTVAEHAMALLLALTRRVPELVEQQAKSLWSTAPAARISSLEGRTMAIVGHGQIGREVARRARAFGMRVVAVSRAGVAAEHADEARPLSALGDVLAGSDAIVMAIALTPQTHHLLDAAMLSRCRPDSVVVNVSRGAVIDQAALCAALAQGRLGGAALDVTDPEPPAPSDPIWSTPNVLLSPHLAAVGSRATEQRIADGMMAALRRVRSA